MIAKKATTQDKVISLISFKLNVPSSRINPYTHLEDDLHLDDFDLMLLIAELESGFNIYLSPEEVKAIKTVQDASFFFQKYAA